MIEENNPNLVKLLKANEQFRKRISIDKLPTERLPEPVAIITCMDPRVNLEALGIPQFSADGSGNSATRIIRTIGAIPEERSLLIGIFLAGIREFIILMHTDCGCCLAHSKIDTIANNMEKMLPSRQFELFKQQMGEPFHGRLQSHLHTFADPEKALIKEIDRLKALPFIPQDVRFHGLLYELESGEAKVIC